MKTKNVGPTIYTARIPSDRYFNAPSKYQDDDYMKFVPVDAFGGFVPQNKSLANLKTNQDLIRAKFNLEVDEGGGE